MPTSLDRELAAATSADPMLTARDDFGDQAFAEGRIVADYYRGLVTGGIPTELAMQLTAIWHNWNPPTRFWAVKAMAAQRPPAPAPGTVLIVPAILPTPRRPHYRRRRGRS